MDFKACIQSRRAVLMEGALGERLKREYGLTFDEQVAMAGLVYGREGRAALRALWTEYLAIAQNRDLPFLAATPTRRANRERVARSHYSPSLIGDNVAFLREIQLENDLEMYIGGLMGCKGDAYTGEGALTVSEARAFHGWQAALFCEAGVDFLYAALMPTLPEAVGMAQALSDTGLPVLLSFTVQADGRLIDGTSIAEAILQIDGLVEKRPVCYLSNCVHPDIVYQALAWPFNRTESVRERFWGIQANTSPLSLAELDGASELRSTEPEVFAQAMLRLRDRYGFTIFGGCCGTDGRHMEAVARKLG